ncbi:Hypothetical predicted protein [Xyrichtys novacula]|uniref:Dmrt1 n=1 Tax=Xyrichtys novacula TaxID=13765 RepID=A0AAV1F9R5_XYRNO|nr:Hypothetical predicted protein [Xyrichtys novacula]
MNRTQACLLFRKPNPLQVCCSHNAGPLTSRHELKSSKSPADLHCGFLEPSSESTAEKGSDLGSNSS